MQKLPASNVVDRVFRLLKVYKYIVDDELQQHLRGPSGEEGAAKRQNGEKKRGHLAAWPCRSRLRFELSLLSASSCLEALEAGVAQGLCHLAVVGSVGSQADSRSLTFSRKGICVWAKAVQPRGASSADQGPQWLCQLVAAEAYSL